MVPARQLHGTPDERIGSLTFVGVCATLQLMSRARDSQRSKFWKAWRATMRSHRGEELSLAECEAFVREVITSRWWLNNGYRNRISTVTVKDGRSRTHAGVWRTSPGRVIITLPTATRRKETILRCLAYYTVPPESAWHSRETCRLLLDMIARFIPKTDEGDLAGELRAQFREHGVKYRRPSQFSPEALERLRATGEALHEQRTERYVAKLEDDYRV